MNNNRKSSELMGRLRSFLKDHIRMETDFRRTEQARGVPPPPIEKSSPEDGKITALPKAGEWRGVQPVSVEEAIRNRESRRNFTRNPLTLDHLSFLLCQNLYLACEAINAGTCAIAAYDQDGMDQLLGVDGQEEFTIYLAPVGMLG